MDNGESTTVVVDLGTAEDFMEYDPVANTFSIKEGVTTDEHVGPHKITVTTTYIDKDGQTWVFQRSFVVNIERPPPEKIDVA